jgi:hypothetical protein
VKNSVAVGDAHHKLPAGGVHTIQHNTGCINTWTFPAVSTSARVNKDIEMFKNNGINTYDYVDYRGNKVVITRNPFGFINEPKK